MHMVTLFNPSRLTLSFDHMVEHSRCALLRSHIVYISLAQSRLFSLFFRCS